MSATDNSILDKLRELRDDYTKMLPQKISSIEGLWKSLLEDEWDREHLATLHRYTHSLAGSGSTFGFDNISDSARTLDTEFKHLIATIDIPDINVVTGIRQKLDSLKHACDEAVSSSKQNQVQDIYSVLHLPDRNAAASTYNILVFEEISGSTDKLMKDLETYDYNVTAYPLNNTVSHTDLQNTVQQQQPKAVLFCIDNFSTEVNNNIAEVNKIVTEDIPSIFICNNGETNQRLNAVRCGSDAFYALPYDTTSLIDQLDGFCNKTETEPYRVMIVDDSASLANAYSMFLQQAGMNTQVVIDPLQACNILCEFKPDLILLDIYMPTCSGPELAAVIRQQVTYASVPIVYLSAEVDVTKQLNAMSQGGDDFLTKPIKPAHLIRAVKIRAERYRGLRGYMVRDSLTGLFNHSKTEEQLHIELSRAERNQHYLAYAMVDIDNFKSINDTYGHAAGDIVLKSLARLMQKTLRKTDIIGRYGGEEFAALLYNANPEQAFDIMENLRTDFEKIEHSYNNQTFNVTFSCGIALYPIEKDATLLHKSADEALYQAKNQGRNKVILAQK